MPGTAGMTSVSLYSLSAISVMPAARAASAAGLELAVTLLAALVFVPVETLYNLHSNAPPFSGMSYS